MRVLLRRQPLSACSELTGNDTFEMRRLIHFTAEDGIERGFAKGPQGYDMCTGTRCSVSIRGRPGDYLFFHTHPATENSGYFSLTDLRNALKVRTYANNCVGFEDENSEPKIKCVFGKDVDPEALAQAQRREDEIKEESKRVASAESPFTPSEVYRYVSALVGDVAAIHERLEEASKVCSEVLRP